MAVEHANEHGSAHGQVDVHADHSGVDAYGNPPEQPAEWGWHHDFGKVARIAGWLTVIGLVLMATPSVTHYNDAGAVSLYITAGLLALGLGWDIHRRRSAWRE